MQVKVTITPMLMFFEAVLLLTMMAIMVVMLPILMPILGILMDIGVIMTIAIIVYTTLQYPSYTPGAPLFRASRSAQANTGATTALRSK